jgi:hypothetical protein
MKTLLSLIIVVIILLIVKCSESSKPVQRCQIKYDTKYITRPPIATEPEFVKIPSFERFYDENMLLHLDDSFYNESNYKTIMKHTNDGALL